MSINHIIKQNQIKVLSSSHKNDSRFRNNKYVQSYHNTVASFKTKNYAIFGEKTKQNYSSYFILLDSCFLFSIQYLIRHLLKQI